MFSSLKRICVIMSAVMLVHSTVLATTVDYTLDNNQNLIITGSTNSAVEGRNVYIQVINQGRDKNNLKDRADLNLLNYEQLINQAVNVQTNSEGIFTYTYKMPDTDGWFKIYADDGNGNDSAQFYFVTPTKKAEIINELKDRTQTISYDSLRTKILNTYVDALDIDLTSYNAVKDNPGVSDKIFLNVFNGITSVMDDGGLKELFYKDVFTQTINVSGASEIESMLGDSNNLGWLGIDLSESVTYETLSPVGISAFYQTLADDTYIESGSVLTNTIRTVLLLTAIEKTTSWAHVNSIIEDNKDIITFNYERYTNHSNRNAIDVSLVGKKYSLATLGETIDTLTASPSAPGGLGGATGPSGLGGSLPITVPEHLQGNSSGNNVGDGIMCFEDVSSHWAKEYIEKLYELGVVNGVNAYEFSPDSNIKREEFIKMLVKLFNLDTTIADGYGFTDIPEEHWCHIYVATAKKYGITQGDGNGAFGVGQNISREDMMVMLKRVCENRGIEMLSRGQTTSFGDLDQISDYARTAVNYMSERGVISGYEDGNFRGNASATRGETAKILSAFVSYIN